MPTSKDRIRKKILEHLEAYPEGQNIKDFEAALSGEVARRTLQRILAELIGEKIDTSGHARARRYFLKGATATASQVLKSKTPLAADTIGGEIQLSKQAQKLIQKVSEPIQKRKPVGYNREFLENYIPNKTSYLSAKEKDALAKLSNTDMNVLPAGTYIRKIYDRLLIDLAFNSSRLEGNTYSLIETKRLLELNEKATGKDLQESTMITNHKEAIAFLVESAEDIGINPYTIKNLHACLSENLLPDPIDSGKIREKSVSIGDTTFIPLDNPDDLKILFGEMLEKADQIEDPFEQALFLMVHIPYLQPFIDVNKRTSRLALNIPFIKKNLCPVSFIDVPKDYYIRALLTVYELNEIDLIKEIFIWAYERSALRYAAIQKSLGEPDSFRAQYREQIRTVVREIIKGGINLKNAPRVISDWMKDKIEVENLEKFKETVEIDLLSLHEGNFARYRVTPNEFEKWNNQKDK